MKHDFSIVFDTENELWQRVLDIYAKNDNYEKKVVKNRNLHHKFPKSFSKKLGEEIDNDEDNLISLSLAEHFLVHYYYYKLAKKGYRQSMATAFTFMARKSIKYITPDTAEAIAKDYEEAKCIAYQWSSDEIKKKISKANKGVNNPFYGKTHSEEARKKMSEKRKGIKRKPRSEETKNKISESMKKFYEDEENRKRNSEIKLGKPHPHKGGFQSEETRRKMSEARKLYWERRKQIN